MADFAADLKDLRAKLREMGCYERPFARLALTWLGLFAVGIGALGAFVMVPFVLVRIAAILVASMAFIGLATLAHTASHGAASDRRLFSNILWYATYPFLLQLSARYWRWSHIQLHHPAPNVVGIDADCDLRPVFALNEEHLEGGSPLFRQWHPWQGYLLPIALLFNGFNLQRQGWARLFHELRHREDRDAGTYADLACMVMHLVVCVALPMAFFPAWKVLGVYSMLVAVMGVGMFVVLAPGHYPADAVCLDKSQRDAGDFYLRQTLTTVNFRTGVLGGLLCSGLDYQIEHHLFPSISHVHLKKASPLVRAFCERHGMPHRTMSWPRAVWESYRVFLHPKPVHHDVVKLRGMLGQTSEEAVTAEPEQRVAAVVVPG